MNTRLRKREQRTAQYFFFAFSFLVTFLFILNITACQPPKPAAQDSSAQEATLEATALGKEVGPWKVITADETKFIVTAPGAEVVKIIYKPITSDRRRAVLGTLTTKDNNGKFALAWKPDADFTGDVWAEAVWSDGTKKKSNVLALTSQDAISLSGSVPLDRIGNSAGTDESARSDKFTKGRIEQTSLVAGDPRIWITVNIPAFRLTLWQNSKEVKTYQIGVGRLNYPLPVGERKATEIVWNPDWIPPDSKWVTDVEPGERIEADDPRNPLGKIKIRLGNAILIHEAAKPTDIGRLVSHGCVRMLTDDLFDLTEKMVAACNLPITPQQIEQAKTNTDRLAVKLDPPIWVDVNYDTQVVEGGELHLYPDVYRREQDSLAALRQTLKENAVPALSDDKLKQLLGRVTPKDEFVISLTDLKAKRALAAGRQVPLVDMMEEKPAAQRESNDLQSSVDTELAQHQVAGQCAL